MTHAHKGWIPDHLPHFLTVAQAASLLAVSTRTVRRWIQTGSLDAVRTARRTGHIRIPRVGLVGFLDRRSAARDLENGSDRGGRE